MSDQEKIEKSCLPDAFIKNNIIFSKPATIDSIEGSMKFKFRETDILLATFPKSGILEINNKLFITHCPNY
jgi:hypothetical protein